MASEATVTLIGPEGRREFRLQHAENILKIQESKRRVLPPDQLFTLPEDSPYTFINDTLQRRSRKQTRVPDQPKRG